MSNSGISNKNVLFIWIPKTAGTSIYNILGKYGCPKLWYEDLLTSFKNKGFSTFGHISIPELISSNIVSNEYFNSAFKFCFVRNPWDRIVSLYFYLKKIDNEEVSKLASFNDFCYYLKDKKITPIGLYNYNGLNQCNSQINWITDAENNIFVDFIGKFENLKNDLKKVFNILGIEEDIPYLNKTSHKDYRDYYTSDTKKIIGSIYEKDIDQFDYSF